MSLAELRAKLTAQENRTQKNAQTNQSYGDNSIYPFWNLTEGQTSTLRFLPDADKSNVYFWVERNMIKLPFSGIKGQSENKPVTVQVPCVEMYGPTEKCPILAEVRTWYKDDNLKELANKYWKKRTYIYQGFVRQNGLTEDSIPENPIRRFVIKAQIHKIIKSSLLDPDFDIMPTDYDAGLDFKIVVGKNGQWADYATSTWARRESALTDVEQAAIEAHGLFDLKEFLPKKPSESELRVIKDMFDASVDGKLYDPDRWASYYKPWGLQSNGASSQQSDDSDEMPSSSKSVVAKTETIRETSAPWIADEDDSAEQETDSVKVADTAASDKAKDILAFIRNRKTTG